MYEFASSSATLLTVYTAIMHTRRMNVIPEVELWNYDTTYGADIMLQPMKQPIYLNFGLFQILGSLKT